MAEKVNGGPAFPDPGSAGWNDPHGMTVRDFLKATAMTAIVPPATTEDEIGKIMDLRDKYAELAGMLADAWIKETVTFYQS